METRTKTMTAKERLLNSITGKETDRLAWSPFLAYYWDFLPEDLRRRGQFAYLRELGADPLLRGFHKLFALEYAGCEVHQSEKGHFRQVVYECGAGTLTEEYRYVEGGRTWFLTKHPVNVLEDVKIFYALLEAARVSPSYEAFLRDYAQVGDQGLHLPNIGLFGKSSFQSLLEHWMGTENLIYLLYDEPEWIEAVLEKMAALSADSVRISADSPAEGFITWEDSSTTNINPDLFERYILPELNAWSDIIHDAGKLLVHHACGQIKALLPLMAASRVDAIESISPPPTGNVELREAKEILRGTNIALIGGIEPTVLLGSSLSELKRYVTGLIADMKGHPFILANSDSCPPGVEEPKFRMVTDMVQA